MGNGRWPQPGENLPPCAGIIQIRFDGRSLDQLPLSPAYRTPVFASEYTRNAGSVAHPAGLDDGLPYLHRTPAGCQLRRFARGREGDRDARFRRRTLPAGRLACADIGRDPDELTYSVALVAVAGANEAEFAGRAAAIGREPAELREHPLAGTPSEIVDRLGTLREGGASRVYPQILDLHDLDHLDFIARQIVPQLG